MSSETTKNQHVHDHDEHNHDHNCCGHHHDHDDHHHDHDDHHHDHDDHHHDHDDHHHDHDDHDDHHHHAHEIGHVHVAQGKLKKAIFIATFILLAEVIGALLSNSLALLADAGHMLTDVASLIIAYAAVRISTKIPSKSMTFGFHRVTVLAALLNAATLIILAIYIGFEAYQRILNPQPVQGAILFATALIGLVLNLYIGLGMRDQAHNINIKSAMLHVLGDAAASAGVIIAGAVMYFTDWYIIDPILSFLIALIVAVGAWRIVKDVYVVLMEGTPANIKYDDVLNDIQSIKGIKEIHDMHIWSLTPGKNALTCHIIINADYSLKESQELLNKIENMLSNEYGISHATVQLEDVNQLHDTSSICCAH